jgi:DHA1 family multidrug resistance protein-like MFS transporter
MLLALGIVILWFKDSPPSAPIRKNVGWIRGWPSYGAIRFALGLAAGGQFGLAIFEGTFAIYAQRRFAYGPGQVGIVFIVCGLVMSVFQYIAVRFLSKVMSPQCQISVGLSLMGVSLLVLPIMKTTSSILLSVGVLAFGMVLVSPNLTALISHSAGNQQGENLGRQSAAESIGQFSGPLFGSLLFSWYAQLPYWVAGAFLISIGVLARL